VRLAWKLVDKYNSLYYLGLYHLPNLFQTRGAKTLPDLSMYLIFLPMHNWCKLDCLLTNARLVHTRYTRVFSKKMPPPLKHIISLESTSANQRVSVWMSTCFAEYSTWLGTRLNLMMLCTLATLILYDLLEVCCWQFVRHHWWRHNTGMGQRCMTSRRMSMLLFKSNP